MRLGLIARGERTRGIGVQSRGYFRHLNPSKVLVVDVGEYEDYPIYPEDFGPQATVVQMAPDGSLPERKVRRWLSRLDVVLTTETTYDWRFCDWARDAGIRTVVACNPEFYRHSLHPLPHPDGWWTATTWRLDQLPAGTRLVPVPVELDRFPNRYRWRDQPPRTPRFLHSAGKFSMFDRAGTETFSRACYLAQTLDATITCLHDLPHECAPAGDWVNVKVGAIPNYWDAYDGYDVLVLPRKYGGLSLPTQEAMAAGLAVVMPAASPNLDWPVVPVPAKRGGRVPLPAGWMPLVDVDPGALATILMMLRDDPKMLREAREASLSWAEANSWDVLRELYERELQRVIDDPLPPPVMERGHHDPFAART